MHRRRHRAEQIPPAARPWLASPALQPSMPTANCTADLSKPRAGEQPPKPGRPRPLPPLIAPPYAPGSTADDAQLQPRHPLQRLLLHCPEGPSFAQRSPPDYTSQAGSGRTLTDELRSRMPELRAREQSVRAERQAILDQTADQISFLRLAETLTAFLQRLRQS